MNYMWNGSLTIALAFVLGSTAIGRADCTCRTCTPAGAGPCCVAETPGSCDNNGCDTGCDSSYIYRSACSSLESTSDGYLWTYGRGRCAKTFRFDGWVESGIMGNSHGVTSYDGHGGNGPMHVFGNQRTDFALQQIYLLGERKSTPATASIGDFGPISFTASTVPEHNRTGIVRSITIGRPTTTDTDLRVINSWGRSGTKI